MSARKPELHPALGAMLGGRSPAPASDRRRSVAAYMVAQAPAVQESFLRDVSAQLRMVAACQGVSVTLTAGDGGRLALTGAADIEVCMKSFDRICTTVAAQHGYGRSDREREPGQD